MKKTTTTKAKGAAIYEMAAFQRFEQQEWYADWRRAIESQNLDYIEQVNTYEPRFWVFMIDWKATPEGFEVWSDRNAEWVKSFK